MQSDVTIRLSPALATYVMAFLCAVRRMQRTTGAEYSHEELRFLADVGDALHNLTNDKTDGVEYFYRMAVHVNHRWAREHGAGVLANSSIAPLYPLPTAPAA